MKITRFVYALSDPAEPELVRYVGRTNGLAKRLRTHIAEAEHGIAIKDVWLMYLRYAGRVPDLRVIEECHASDEKHADVLAKQRESYWIRNLCSGAELCKQPILGKSRRTKVSPGKDKGGVVLGTRASMVDRSRLA
jgi:hypothetical protein